MWCCWQWNNGVPTKWSDNLEAAAIGAAAQHGMSVDVVTTACGVANTGAMEYQSNEVTIEAATVEAAAHSQHDVSMVCFVATTTVDVTMEVAACDAAAVGTMEYQPSGVAAEAATIQVN